MGKTIIIAEAGVNHNGNVETAKELIRVASRAGADFVKFQTFVPELNISESAPKAEYQKQTMGEEISQLDMVKKLALSRDDHFELNRYCESLGIKFLSTAFDVTSVDLLNDLGIPIFKIPSGELTNLILLKKIAQLNKPLIVSTGMAEMFEINQALNIILENSSLTLDDITILHCNTEYPTPFKDVNLNAMLTIANEFKTKIGYSDHTLGIEVPIAAVALGATLIEKHFTLDRSLPGPDHKASLEPQELKAMVDAIRNIEKALGDGIKTASESEKRNISIARKSLHTTTSLEKGTVLKEEHLIPKRPGDGISPMLIDKIIGRKLNRNVPKDHKISEADFQH
jgi:N,N'-diacetyllegionaminate synthase